MDNGTGKKRGAQFGLRGRLKKKRRTVSVVGIPRSGNVYRVGKRVGRTTWRQVVIFFIKKNIRVSAVAGSTTRFL